MTDYPFRTSVDRNPEATERAVLEVLATGTWWRPRQLQVQVFGTDLAGAGNTRTALARLARKNLAYRGRSGFWRVTPSGVAALELAVELDGAA